MRILQVVPSYLPAYRYGGPIRSVHGLACSLVKRGHEVQVYTTSMNGKENLFVPLAEPVDLDGVRVTYFPVPWMRRLAWAPELANHLRRNIHSFDIVHLHSVFLWPTWAAARAAKKAGKPYLLSPRGMLVGDLIRRKNRWVKRAWIELIERKTIANAAGVHVTTDLEAADIRALHLKLPEVHCVPNGVDWPSSHKSLSSGPFANLPRPYALFLSRINWKKGLERLIKAWIMVPDLHLIIAGNDEENYLPSLKALTQQVGVTDRVLFVGPVVDDEKWALYEHAEMFILPSYSENFGNVVAEAMAMSCPVVVTAGVGLATVVRDSQCGVVSGGEPFELAATVNKLHGDSTTLKRMGHLGRETAVRAFSWSEVGRQMEGLYLHALGASQ